MLPKIDHRALEALPEGQRNEALRLFAELEAAHRANPLYGYVPHPKQIEFHSSKEPAKCFLGGNRSGKTTAGILDDLIQSIDRDMVPSHLQAFKTWDPPFFCRVVSPDFTSTMEGVIFQKLREWVPRSQLIGDSWGKAYDKQRRRLSFKNGSWMDFMTFEQDLDKFGGAALHRVHYDEEPPRLIRQESRMRLIDFAGDELFTMTPLQGMCVDGETEILTKWGWMTQDQLAEGIPVLTYNAETGYTEWQPLIAVHRDRHYAGPMFKLDGHLDAVFTGDHRWVTGSKVVPFGELKKTSRVRVAARHENVNASRLQGTFCELVGWVLSEGSMVKDENKVVVYQSVSRYPEHCERIEMCLRSVDAQYHWADRPYKPDGTIRRYVMTGDVARQLRFLIGRPKALDPTWVTGLALPQLQDLFKGLMGGDGHYTKTGSWHFTASDKGLAGTVQMVAILLGWRSNIRHFEQHGKTVWRTTGSPRHEITEFKRRAEPCESPGFVWCPKTRNGTWVARRNGTAFITGNSWMFHEIYRPWEAGVLEDASVVVVDMDDNPHLDERTKRRVLAGLSVEERAARKSGRFVHFAGLVYHEFSRVTHLAPDGEVPAGAVVVGAIDPGTRHMAAVVWAYLGYDDDLIVFEELALKSATVADVSKAIRRVETKHRIRVPYYVIDPAARNVAHQTGRSDQMEYMDNGIVTILGQNAVTAGINRVKERLQTERLHVMAHCSQLIDEFEMYRWITQNRSEHEAKEQVVKRDDHLLDALRYLVMSRPHRPERDPVTENLDPFTRAMREEMSGRSLRRKRVPRSPEYGGIYS